MNKSNLHSKHRDRVRERYIKEGIDSFEPHQVLELVLFYAIPRKDTNEIAHRLLNKFGDLSGVFEAPPEELMTVEGIGEGTAIFLNMFSQVGRRYDLDKIKNKVSIGSTCDAGEFCIKLFQGRIYETFFVISLNSQNKIINIEKLSEGTTGEAVVYPRNIARAALRNNASKIILTHNHPGGVRAPSKEDVSLTRSVKAALDSVDVLLNDHIIVAEDGYYSFAECGFI